VLDVISSQINFRKCTDLFKKKYYIEKLVYIEHRDFHYNWHNQLVQEEYFWNACPPYHSTSNIFILYFIVNQDKLGNDGSKLAKPRHYCYLPSSENDTEP
jgi:hypothetical protein